MADILIRLNGAVEQTLRRLVDAGFFRTKAEAVRAGILELGKEYSVVKSKDEILDELAVVKMQKMDKEIMSGKKKALKLADVRKKYPEAFE